MIQVDISEVFSIAATYYYFCYQRFSMPLLSVTPEDFLKLRYANSNKNESCGKCSILGSITLLMHLFLFTCMACWWGVLRYFLSQKKVFALCL